GGGQVTAPVVAPVRRATPATDTAGAGSTAEAKRGRTARVAVLGASGYSGHEVVRLALAHPGIEIAARVSREPPGRPAAQMLPGPDARARALPVPVAPDALPGLLAAGAFDTLVTCLPHGAWKQLAADQPALANDPALVIDLSSDFRDGTGTAGSQPYV